jgi:hypothetical protein
MNIKYITDYWVIIDGWEIPTITHEKEKPNYIGHIDCSSRFYGKVDKKTNRCIACGKEFDNKYRLMAKAVSIKEMLK